MYYIFFFNQIQQEHLIKHDNSWIIVTNRSTHFKFESPMAQTSLVKFTSWDSGLTDELTRVNIFLNFILQILNGMSKYRTNNLNCDLSSKESTLQKRREIEDAITSVCIQTQ